MKHLENKIDKILEDLNEVKIIQARHTVLHEKNSEDLERHILRTDLAETRIEMLTKADSELKDELMQEITPIKNHINTINVAVKILLWVMATMGAILLGLHQLGILNKLF